MYRKISTANMSRREWLMLRKTGIGGSDAGAICGVNPFSSPLKIFKDKTSLEIEEQDRESLRQGSDLEDYVAKRFMEATGLKVRRSNYMYQSLQYPFMLADVDRLVVSEDAGLECKTVNAFGADKWKDGKIPLHYVLQCYHYMAVTGKRTWYIAAVILGTGFVHKKLVWDDELIRQLIETERNFWLENVTKGILPEPDGSDVSNEIINQYFHTAKKDSAIELVGFDGRLQRREEILSKISELEKEQNQIEQEIKMYMKDHELALSNHYRVSWSNVESTRLDTKKFKEEHPEMFSDYAKVTNSRRFQIKAA